MLCILHSLSPHPCDPTEFKLALVQLAVCADKTSNIVRACQKVREAVSHGAEVVVLPVSTVTCLAHDLVVCE